MYHQKLTTYEFKRVIGTQSREGEKNRKEREHQRHSRICFFLKDLNHKIILRYNIISCREREKRQSAEEIQIAKCDSDCSNNEKRI